MILGSVMYRVLLRVALGGPGGSLLTQNILQFLILNFTAVYRLEKKFFFFRLLEVKIFLAPD